MNEFVVLAGSAVVVAFMVGVAALLGFRAGATLDEAALARLAAQEGGALDAYVISDTGAAALVRMQDGRFIAVRAMGADISARVFARGQARFTLREGRLDATFADVGYPSLHLRLAQSPPWLAELAWEGSA